MTESDVLALVKSTLASVQIKLATKAAALWPSSKVLLAGQLGHEGDTKLSKIGDGFTPWSSLDYLKVRGADVVQSTYYRLVSDTEKSSWGGAATHAALTGGNPHNVTKADLGIANVDNTSDINKPVSTAQAAADTTTLNSAKSYADGLIVSGTISAPLVGFTAGAGTISAADTILSGFNKMVGNLAAWKVPAGGTKGQVLAKSSATDYAVTWVTKEVRLVDYLPVGFDPSVTDCTPYLQQLITENTSQTSTSLYYREGPKIIFPKGKVYLASTWHIKETLFITGEGGYRHSIIQFPVDTDGIVVDYFDTYGKETDARRTAGTIPPYAGSYSIIEHIRLEGGTTTTNATALVAGKTYRITALGSTDFRTVGSYLNFVGTTFVATGPATGSGKAIDTAIEIYNGLTLHARATVRHVHVNNFSGDDVFVFAAAGLWGGNANNFLLKRVIATSAGKYNFHIAGPDANAGNIIGCSANTGERGNFFDSSFLGNTYTGCYCQVTGIIPTDVTPAQMKRGRRYKIMIANGSDYTSSGSANNNPGTSFYFNGKTVLGDGTGIVRQYSAAYLTDSDNARSVFTGCYSEGGQGASEITGGTMWIGGLNESGVITNGASLSIIGSNVDGTLKGNVLCSTSGVLSYDLGSNEYGSTYPDYLLNWYNDYDHVSGQGFRYSATTGGYIYRNATTTLMCFTNQGKAPETLVNNCTGGRGVFQPYSLFIPKFFLGPLDAARSVTAGTAIPTTGTAAEGGIIFNTTGSGYAGLMAASSGTAGTLNTTKTIGDITSGTNQLNLRSSGTTLPANNLSIGDKISVANAINKATVTDIVEVIVAATALVNGTTYIIKTLGTTNFIPAGASANTVGITFVANGPTTGTGTVYQSVTALLDAYATQTVASASVSFVPPVYKQFGVIGSYGAAAVPTTGTHEKPEIIYNTNAVVDGFEGWTLVSNGTFGNLNAGNTTATTTAGSKDIIVSASNGITPGVYVSVAGAITLAKVKNIVTLAGVITVTVDTAASASVTGAAMNYIAPVFYPFGIISDTNPTAKLATALATAALLYKDTNNISYLDIPTAITDPTLSKLSIRYGGSEIGRLDGYSGGFFWNSAVTIGTTTNRVGISPGSAIIETSGTGSADKLKFANGNGVVGSITTNGMTTTYATTSDRRFKKNIQPALSSWNLTKSIGIVSFDFKADNVHVPHGVIAQDLYNYCPQAVVKGDDNPTVITKAWGVDGSQLVPTLTKTLQEAQARIEHLESIVARLESIIFPI